MFIRAEGCPGEEVTSSKDTVTAKSDRTSPVTQTSQDTTIHHCNGDIGKYKHCSVVAIRIINVDHSTSQQFAIIVNIILTTNKIVVQFIFVLDPRKIMIITCSADFTN